MFVAASHDPRVPVHAVALVVAHSTQPPSTQAGNAAVGHASGSAVPKSLPQGPQPFALQIGRPFGQSVEALHV